LENVETKAAISKAHIGKTFSTETKAAMSKAKSGENHPMYGKTHTAEAKAAISSANSGRTHTAETKALMSEAKMGNTNAPRMSIFVYEQETRKLVKEFPSQVTAAIFLKVSRYTVQNYLATGKVLNNKYIIRSSTLS
jgi:group I intron endonuclease